VFGTYFILRDKQQKRDERKGKERRGMGREGEIFRRGRKRKRAIGDRKRGMRPSEVLNYVNPGWIGRILDYYWTMRRSDVKT
jgi:hypothetical protein